MRPVLPESEVTYLNSLDDPIPRLKALRRVGWSIGTLASAFTPKKPKSTVYSWVIDTSDVNTNSDTSAPSVPIPPKSLPRPRPISPQPPPAVIEKLASLSSLARLCRAKTPPSSPYRKANEELTDLALSLYASGVPVDSIARAAGVSARAMYRRVAKGLGRLSQG